MQELRLLRSLSAVLLGAALAAPAGACEVDTSPRKGGASAKAAVPTDLAGLRARGTPARPDAPQGLAALLAAERTAAAAHGAAAAARPDAAGAADAPSATAARGR